MSFGHSHRHEVPVESCLARSVADALAEEPALEAVTIDSAHNKISVATLGRTDVDRLEADFPDQVGCYGDGVRVVARDGHPDTLALPLRDFRQLGGADRVDLGGIARRA